MEKEGQVRIMSSIFSGAQRVHVHLGRPTHLTEFGFKALEEVRRSPTTAWKDTWRDHPGVTRAGILDVMGRAWWTRIWCIQESVVAKELFIMCGEHSMMWSNTAKEVFMFWRSLKAAVLSPAWEQYDVGINRMNHLTELLRLQLDSGPGRTSWAKAKWRPDLLDMAYDMRHRLSSDPRDRLYGLVGLAKSANTDASEYDHFVDYSLSHMDSYERNVRVMLPQTPFERETKPPTEEFEPQCFSRTQALCTTEIPGMIATDPLTACNCSRSSPQKAVEAKIVDDTTTDSTIIDMCDSTAPEKTWAPLSVAQIQNEAEKGLAAVRAGQIEHAAEFFLLLRQRLRDQKAFASLP